MNKLKTTQRRDFMERSEQKRTMRKWHLKKAVSALLCAGMLLTSVDVTALAAEASDAVTAVNEWVGADRLEYAFATPDITPDRETPFGACALSDGYFRRSVGDSVEMKVHAWSTMGTLQYTWYAPSGEELEETGDLLKIAELSADDFGTYTCEVTDGTEEHFERVRFSVSGTSALYVTGTKSETSNLEEGDDVIYTVEAVDYRVGSQPLTYQWYKGSKAIDGATEPSYTFQCKEGKSGKYSCVVSNGIDTVKKVFDSFTVTTPYLFLQDVSEGSGLITRVPDAYTGYLKYYKTGQSVKLKVKTNLRNVSYVWKKDGTVIEGADSEEYIADPKEDGEVYICEVTGSGQTQSIGYKLECVDTDVILNGNMNIMGQPVYKTAIAGDLVKLDLIAYHTQNVTDDEITYQWYKRTDDGDEQTDTPIDQATELDYIVNVKDDSDFGTYVVKAFYGDGESSECICYVNKKIFSLTQSAVKAYDGMPVTYAIDFEDTGVDPDKFSYQWYQHTQGQTEEKAITGAVERTLTVPYNSKEKNIVYNCHMMYNGIKYVTGDSYTMEAIAENGTEWTAGGHTSVIQLYFNRKRQESITLDPYVVKGSQAKLSYRWERSDGIGIGMTWNDLACTDSVYEADVDELDDSSYSTQIIAKFRVTITDSQGNDQQICFDVYQNNTLHMPDGAGFNGISGAYEKQLYAAEEEVCELDPEVSTTNGTISYHWEKKENNGEWEDVPDAENAVYQFVMPKVDYSNYVWQIRYRCVMTDGNQTKEYIFVVSRDALQPITNRDNMYLKEGGIFPGERNVSIDAGEYRTYSGKKEIEYQWYKENGYETYSALVDSSHIQGAKTNRITFDTIGADDYGRYYCMVRCGSLSLPLSYFLEWNPVMWKGKQNYLMIYSNLGEKLCLQPDITIPEDVTVDYQWYYLIEDDEKVLIEGATEPTYLFTVNSQDDYRRYGCEVSVDGMTREIECEVSEIPQSSKLNALAKGYYSHDINKRAALGESVPLGVAAYCADGTPEYQWEVFTKVITGTDTFYTEYQPLENATSADYVVKLNSDQDYATYRCVITDPVTQDKCYVTYHIYPKREETPDPTPTPTPVPTPSEDGKKDQNTTVAVTSVNLNKTEVELVKGAQETLTASVLPENASNPSVTWSSSDPSVASVENGTITANKKGTAVITVTTADGAKTANCTVKVLIPAEKVMILKSKSLVKGDTFKLKAVVLPKDTTDVVEYTSSNEKVATVSKDGKVKAVAAGTAKITAKSASGKKAVCTINVVRKKISAISVKLNRQKLSVQSGEILQLQATTSPAKSTDTLKWKSSNKKIAGVDQNGVVTIKRSGKAKITVKIKNGKKAVCEITVTQPAQAVTLNKTAVTMKVKQTLKLKASMKPSDATSRLKWTSSNKKIATVDKKGKVTAVKKGKAVITVKTDNGRKATCKITVK